MNADTFRQAMMVFVVVCASLAAYNLTRPAETEERIVRVPKPVPVTVERTITRFVEVLVTITPAPSPTPEPQPEPTPQPEPQAAASTPRPRGQSTTVTPTPEVQMPFGAEPTLCATNPGHGQDKCKPHRKE